MQSNVKKLFFQLCLAVVCASALPAATPGQVTFETPFLRLRVAAENGGFEILDKAGQVTWRSNPFHARFGEITLTVSGKQQRVDLSKCEVAPTVSGLDLTFKPIPGNTEAWVRVGVRTAQEGHALELSYQAAETLTVENIRLLDEALWVTDTDKGFLAVPVREGMLVPADSRLAFTHRFDTFAYEGCHMEMLGVVKRGAAALITWHDPYVAVDVRSVLTNAIWAHGQQLLSPSLVLRKSAKACQIHFLGKGDYISIATAYREYARDKGWLVTWGEKLKDHPDAAKLFGAINFKLWSTLDRRMNEASTSEERVRVNWTFDEAAQVAEHLKTDLQLDKVLFIMGGWIHRGYDNQHPDILPSAPECGGDAAFAECARRVRNLGYLFCLHDNYQDIYRDSRSWDENLVMKNRDGSLSRGGHWAGGLAYLTCSEKALALAQRPQNLPAVRKLTGADAYFIDTTYAAGLQECFDKNHPLTRWDDMKWKQTISDYGREVFGLFGSECGREWAIPHSDFFEGLTGVDGRAYHDANLLGKVGGVVVPLFEVVYRDCIAMYGKYGYDISQSAEYVLQHIAIGRPLHYHNVPAHLYWKADFRAAPAPDTGPDRGVFTRAAHGWADGLHPLDRFVKNTAEILSPLNELTAKMTVTDHAFLTPDRTVQRTQFGAGTEAVHVIVNGSDAEFRCPIRVAGEEIVLPAYGFLVSSPTFVAFNALQFGGLSYPAPTLFTIRSLDGRPLYPSSRARVFHGFGHTRLKWGDKTHSVEREASLSL
jgi:hypothetical protein